MGAHPSNSLHAEIGYRRERESDNGQNTDYSFFYPSREYRPLPAVDGGTLGALEFSLRYGAEPVPLELIAGNFLELAVEYADPDVLGGDFAYAAASAQAMLVIPTFGRSLLLPAQLRIRVLAGVSGSPGILPRQKLFSLESASSGVGPFGVMRGMGVKEYSGTDVVSVALEHNFRSLPFHALDIPFLYERSIEFLVHAGLAHAWQDAAWEAIPSGGSRTDLSPGGWYAEAGFGFSRIFDLFRIDATWRLRPGGLFRVTVATGSIL